MLAITIHRARRVISCRVRAGAEVKAGSELKLSSVVDGRQLSTVVSRRRHGDLALPLLSRFTCMVREHDQKKRVLQSSVESGMEDDRRRQVAHVPLTGGGPG